MRLFLTRPTLWLFILVAAVINQLTSSVSSDFHTGESGWLFRQLPHFLSGLVANPVFWVLLVPLTLVKIAVDLVTSFAMYRTYQQRSIALRETVGGALSATNYSWMLLAQLALYAGFLAFAAVSFFTSYAIWHLLGFDFSYALVGIAILVYPLYYAMLAMSALVAVFPWTASGRRRALVGVFWRWGSLWRAYLIYGLRILIEVTLLTIGLALAVLVFHSRLVATVSVLVALTLPLVLVRGASYGASLALLADQVAVSTLFRQTRHASDEEEPSQPR